MCSGLSALLFSIDGLELLAEVADGHAAVREAVTQNVTGRTDPEGPATEVPWWSDKIHRLASGPGPSTARPVA